MKTKTRYFYPSREFIFLPDSLRSIKEEKNQNSFKTYLFAWSKSAYNSPRLTSYILALSKLIKVNFKLIFKVLFFAMQIDSRRISSKNMKVRLLNKKLKRLEQQGWKYLQKKLSKTMERNISAHWWSRLRKKLMLRAFHC